MAAPPASPKRRTRYRENIWSSDKSYIIQPMVPVITEASKMMMLTISSVFNDWDFVLTVSIGMDCMKIKVKIIASPASTPIIIKSYS